MLSEDNLALEPYPISVIRKILDCIEKKRNIRVDIGRIPLDDRETLELFKKGDTDGVFGFDAPDIQEYSKQLKPDSFDELMILGALCGPARAFRPAQQRPIYFRCLGRVAELRLLRRKRHDDFPMSFN